jgi:hypothetical protein
MLGAVMLLLAPGSRRADAQGAPVDPQCAPSTPDARAAGDACQKALDLFAFLAPQLGAAIAGGNAASGEHSSLQGGGRISLGLRINIVDARLPRIGQHEPVVTGAQASDYDVERQAVPVPTLDAAIGVYRGIPVGGTNTLGIDLLVNLAYIPSFDRADVSVTPRGSSFKVGIGGRLTIVEETFMTPGIALTWLRRDLPVMDVHATPGNDELRVDDVQVETRAWRAVIGKTFSLIGVTIGGGQDRYATSAIGHVTVNSNVASFEAGPIAALQELTRDNVFGSVALNLPVLRVVAEVGRSSGGRLGTFNTFGDRRADDPVSYGSLALRFRW